MLLNLFIIIHHVMPIRIWINTVRLFPFHESILVLKIVNLIILILRIERGRNLPVGVHYIEINQIVINHILALWYKAWMTAFWRLRRWTRVVAWRAWAGWTRGALGWGRTAPAYVQRTAYTLRNFIDSIQILVVIANPII